MYSHLNHSAKFGLQLLRGIVLFVAFTFNGSISQAQIKLDFTFNTMYFKDDGVGINWSARPVTWDDAIRKSARMNVLLCHEENEPTPRVADQKPYDEAKVLSFHFFDKRTMIVGQKLQYEIQVQAEDGKVLLTHSFTLTIPKPLPYAPTPTGLKLELAKEGDKRFLIWTWDKPKEADQLTDGFKLGLYKKNGKLSDSIHEKIDRNTTSYKQEILEYKDDTWHCYLEAIPKAFAAQTSHPCEKVKIFIPGASADRVKNLKATHDYTKPGIVSLKWEHENPSRLKGFRIYDRDTLLISEDQCPAKQMQWVFKDVPLKTNHQYNVKAVTPYGYVSYDSNGNGQVYINDQPPTQPNKTALKLSYQWLEDQTGKVLIKWDAIDKAVKYEVKYITVPNIKAFRGSYSESTTIAQTQTILQLDPEKYSFIKIEGLAEFGDSMDRSKALVLPQGLYYEPLRLTTEKIQNEEGKSVRKLKWKFSSENVDLQYLTGFELLYDVNKVFAGPDVLTANMREYLPPQDTKKGLYKFQIRVVQKNGKKSDLSNFKLVPFQ